MANVVCVATPRSTICLGGLAAEQRYEALPGWALRSAEVGAFPPLPAHLTAARFARVHFGVRAVAGSAGVLFGLLFMGSSWSDLHAIRVIGFRGEA